MLKTFRQAIRNSDFAVSAEIYLRPETDAASLRAQADTLKDSVDGILLTDNQYGQLHLSTTAAAAILLDHGTDPIVQLTSRNRNRIALVSDLLGAATVGVTSLMLVAGERAPEQFQPRPKPVLDVNAVDLIRIANTVNADENLTVKPDFLVGGVVTPVMPKPDWKAKQLREKVDAGAHYLQTHICMDVTLLRRYLKHLVANKLIQRTSIVGAVAVLGSAEDARWLKDNRPNVMLPDRIIGRLEKSQDPRREGILIAAETIDAMTEMPGIVGVNLMASKDLTAIPEVIAAAGIHG
ncbi:MAG: hypothetical protein CMO98_08915 [Woeseia sp.]|nr:hypothetical protein [Woeseia sp.]